MVETKLGGTFVCLAEANIRFVAMTFLWLPVDKRKEEEPSILIVLTDDFLLRTPSVQGEKTTEEMERLGKKKGGLGKYYCLSAFS